MLMDFIHPVEAVIPGTTGKILSVLTATTGELSLRTIARTSEVSPGQVSRILPPLVQLGIIERRDVPPATMYRLVPEHVTARLLLSLSRSREAVLEEMGHLANHISPPPVSVIVFGSLARGDADVFSDIDVVIVRLADVGEDEERWQDSVEAWRHEVRRLTGNRVSIVEVGENEIGRLLRSRRPLWQDIRRDGVEILGLQLYVLDGRQGA